MFRLLRSSSVKLALSYAGLFVASSLLLVGLLWWGTAGYLDRETTAVIRADVTAVRDDLPYRGIAGVIETVEDRAEAATDGRAGYLLADARLKPIVGNIATWPAEVKPKPGWYQASIILVGRYRTMEIESVVLPGGYHLLVGHDIQDRAAVRAMIVKGLGWAAAGAFVIAIVGGLFVRRAVLRRIEAINTTAGAIVHGDLSRRLPTRDNADEFDQLAQTINLMLAQIETLIERVRNTTNTVAHDLRTPLGELRAELEDLTRGKVSSAAILDGVQKAVSRLDRVIGIFNALLRLAEIDSGTRRSGFRHVDAAALAVEVAELYTPLAEEKGVAFELSATGESAVNGDPYLLAQAVGNLVDNAVKYAPRRGSVSLCVAPVEDGHVDITVTDDGPGIADGDKGHVTERFYRCQGEDKPNGVGLGLSLVEAVARLHNGRLQLLDHDPGLVAVLSLPSEETIRSGNAPAREAVSN